jgi:uncharacterized membrane protein
MNLDGCPPKTPGPWDWLRTWWRHLRADLGGVARSLDAAALERVGQAITRGEQDHRGEVQVLVESQLPQSELWRGWREGLHLSTLVRQRACFHFARMAVWDTADNNGVLIYLLLAEHRIEIVADRGVSRHVRPDEFETCVAEMAQAFKAGQFEAGLLQAVQQVHDWLARDFPASPEHPDRAGNERPDWPVRL